MLGIDWVTVVSVVSGVIWLLGALSAVHAVMTPRSPRGAVSWAFALLTLPWIGLPFYWVLGRPKFTGYVESREESARSSTPSAMRSVGSSRGSIRCRPNFRRR